MKERKHIPCAITISKPQGGMREPCITVNIEDQISGIHFVEASFTLSAFMEALTGLGSVKGNAEVFGLEFVGLKRVSEDRTINCPLSVYDGREKLEQWLEQNGQEEGWLVSTYLGSKTSVRHAENGCILRYSVTKYVQP